MTTGEVQAKATTDEIVIEIINVGMGFFDLLINDMVVFHLAMADSENEESAMQNARIIIDAVNKRNGSKKERDAKGE